MDAFVLTLVLLAALLHAGYSTVIKAGGDPWVRLAAGLAVGSVLAALLLPFVGLPAPQAWPYIAASTAIHTVYYVVMVLSYRFGDLSQVYPIARGIAPMLVALGGFLVAGEALSLPEAAAVSLIGLAILSLTFVGGRRPGDGRGIAFALLTGLTICGYTLVDGLGGRAAGNVFAYIAWLFALESIPFVLLVLLRRRRVIGPTLRQNGRSALIVGVFGTLAYGCAIWAMSLAPMAHVSALRETSVLFAALFGTRLLKEPFGGRRVAAAAAVALGVVLLQADRLA